MAKKPFNVLSATALAAVLASSAIVPTAVFAAETTQSVQNVIVEHEGEIFELSYEDYTNAKSAGVNFGEVKYVVSSNGKQYKYSDFTQAKPVGSTVDGTLELLEKDPTNVQDVTPGKVIIGEDGKPEYVPPVVNEDFEVTDIAAINKTSVTVTLKDTPSESPGNEDFNVTVGGEEVAVTNVTPVVSDVTGKTFQLAVNLDKKAGKVSINGVESTTSFDYVAPTIANVQALDAKHVAITFSEELAATGANDVANYSLYDVNTGTLHALSSTFRTGSATAQLQADKKTVVITFSGSITDGQGFVLGGLSNGKYLLYVDQSATNKVQDLATPANQVLANLNVEFNGTTAPAEVSIKAQSASYSKAEKSLTVTFNEPTDKMTANVDVTKFALSNGTTSVVLTGATPTFPTSSTQVNFDLSTMSAVDYAKVEALTGNLSVVIADGAYKDANTENAKGNTVVVTEKVLPVVTGAGYNTETNVLKLNFDQDIDLSKVVSFAGITVNGVAINPGATVKTTANGKTVEIQLTKAQAKAVETTGADIRVKTVEDTTVVVPANLFTKVGATSIDKGQNVATTITKAPITHDATAPTVEFNLKSLNTGVGTLTITASEELEKTTGQFDGTKVKFYAADDLNTPLGSLAAGDNLTQVGTTNVYTVSLATNSSTLATALNTAVTAGKKIVTTIEKDAIKDINLTGNEAVEGTSPLQVSVAEGTYGNPVTVKTAVKKTSNLVTVDFEDASNNDVRLDAAIAKNNATYEFVSTANPAIKVAATAEYVWNGTTGELRVVPVTPLAPGSYDLTITGLKTSAGLAIEDVSETGKVKITAISIVADLTKPQLSTATKAGINIVDKDNSGSVSAGDQIVLTFDEPIKLAGASAADFLVDNGHTLGSALVATGSDATQVVITLASNSTIAIGDQITVNETAKITDLAGNQIDSTLVNKQTGALAKPAGVVAPKIKEAKYADTNVDGAVSTGDILTVKFDQVVKLDSNKTASDLINDIVVPGATFTSATLNGDTLTLVVGTPGTLAVGVDADVNGTAGQVDLLNGWGDKIATGTKAIVSDDKTAPTVTGLTYNAPTNELSLAFSEAVNLKGTAATIAANVLAKLDADDLGVATNATLSSDKKSVILQLNGTEVIDQFTTVLIKAGALGDATDYVQDASNNKATRGKAAAYTVTITNVAPSVLTIAEPTLTTSKAYDGDTSAVITAGALSGIKSGHDVTVSAVATYDTPALGSGKTITVKYTLGGADAAKYITPADKVVTTGEITAAPLTVTAPSLTDTKVYDGNNTAAVTAGTLSGVAPTENVTVSATATYDNANAGTGKTITVAYTLSGTDAAKYTAPANEVVETGEITAAPLTINSAAVVDNKEYDGLTAATVSTQPTLTGVLPADVVDVTVNATGAFEDANVANGKTVNLTYTLDGAAAENYSLASTTVTADITAKQLTILDPVATKVYDSTNSATVTGTLAGLVGTDDVTVTGTGTYDTADVGTGKTVSSINYTLGGAKAGNYSAPVSPPIADGVITAAPLTGIEAITGTAIQEGVELTAGGVTPSDATVTYEWQIADSADGSFSAIPSATSATYTPVAGDVNKFIRVVVTGSGNYSGTATSAVTTEVKVP